MIQVCPKCAELVPKDREHTGDADCLAALKAKVDRIRKVNSVARFQIARCQDRGHRGQKVHPKLALCWTCITAGYGAFATTQEIILGAQGAPPDEPKAN